MASWFFPWRSFKDPKSSTQYYGTFCCIGILVFVFVNQFVMKIVLLSKWPFSQECKFSHFSNLNRHSFGSFSFNSVCWFEVIRLIWKCRQPRICFVRLDELVATCCVENLFFEVIYLFWQLLGSFFCKKTENFFEFVFDILKTLRIGNYLGSSFN